MKNNIIPKVLACTIVAVFFTLTATRADDTEEEKEYYSHHLSHEALIEIRKKGGILDLEEIITRINKDRQDRILEVELLKYDNIFIYEVEILKSGGKVVTDHYDGKTGEKIKNLEEE